MGCFFAWDGRISGDGRGGFRFPAAPRRGSPARAGAYHCVHLAATESFAKKSGAILITGGGFALSPSAAYLPLSMDKAALRAMVLALAPALKARGIYLGTVQVTGVIGGSERFMPETIARKFLELYDARDAAELVY